ncbi:MAG: septum formation family protein [Nakamurella sp.]
MDRRLTGLVALLAAALLVVAVAGANRPHVTGAASAVPPGPPPQVGECVAQPFPVIDKRGPAVGRPAPTVELGGCEDPHHGEVIVVVDLTRAVTMADTDECAASPDPFKFVGIDALAVDAWVATPDIRLVSVTPDPRQAAAGQRWVACVIGTRAGSPPYAGSLRDAYLVGTPPPALGSCVAAADQLVAASRVTCGEPHRAELFARYRLRDTAPDETTLERSCGAVISAWTGIPDLGGVAGLRVAVTREEPLAPDAGRGGLVACGIAADGDRLLAGSLLSAGSGPLPWG